MKHFLTSFIAQVFVIICLPILVVIGTANMIHQWALKQCESIWYR